MCTPHSSPLLPPPATAPLLLLLQCEALVLKMNPLLSGVLSASSERACECAGCCAPKEGSPTCFYPVTEHI
jgi:hypothetical protein